MEMDHTQNLWHLPRGGLLISTSSGPVQFGVPPETIKDSMTSEIGVPATFILPPLLFSMDQGISFSELEFPIYYNFFFRKFRHQYDSGQSTGSGYLYGGSGYPALPDHPGKPFHFCGKQPGRILKVILS